MAAACSLLTLFELEQEGSGSLPTVYDAVLMGLRLRVTREWVFLRSPCCGEPLEAWGALPVWSCGRCDRATSYSSSLPDRSAAPALALGLLESWAALPLEPLQATLQCSLAFDELAEAYGKAFGRELGRG